MLWLRRLNTAALLLCFALVVLGAYVRLSDAGLGCPDWPTCYGMLTVPATPSEVAAGHEQYPQRPVEAHKAWKEMIHRYVAMLLGLLIVAQALASLFARNGRAVSLALVPLVGLQAWFGRLTVTWQLKPLAVTAHLLGGMTTLALLVWLWCSLRPGSATPDAPARTKAFRSEREVWFDLRDQSSAVPASPWFRKLAAIALALLAVQIFLGGWTSSNYAATACPEFPECWQDAGHRSHWLPQLHLVEAFTLWRGLGRNYEGGVLETPARQTIHVAHRIGAAVVTLVTALLAFAALLRGRPWRLLALAVLAALALQVALGIGLVELKFPLLVAAAHNAGAALLLASLVSLNFHAWKRDPVA